MQSLEQNKTHDLSASLSGTQWVLYNAIIYSPSHPDANALVVENEKIIWLGDSRVAEQLYPHYQWIDLAGRWIAPLFVNAHFPLPEVHTLKSSSCSGTWTHLFDRFPDFSAIHIHADQDEYYFSLTDQTPEYIFYHLMQPGAYQVADHLVRYALSISRGESYHAILSILTEVMEKQVPLSLLVSTPEEVDLLIQVLSDLSEKYSSADMIAAGIRFEYTIPCSERNQAELARLNIPICIAGQSIIDNYSLNPVPQDLSLFMRAGNILALGFSHESLESWDNLFVLTQETEVFYPIGYRSLFHAATRGGYRIAGESDLGKYEIRVAAEANFAIWEVDEYTTPTKNNSTLGRWSLDPRSRTPLLPQLASVRPRFWRRCYQGNLTGFSTYETGAQC